VEQIHPVPYTSSYGGVVEESPQVSVAKLLGTPPYGGPENTSRYCGLFLKSLEERHGKEVVQQEMLKGVYDD